jgi:S1-C subfamily serine protease
MDENDPEQTGNVTHLRQRLRSTLKKLRGPILFAAGILTALLAVYVYALLTPKPELMTEQQLNNKILEVMAEATPEPSIASQVYQFIQPSLVLIQTHTAGGSGESGDSLGSGVVISNRGEILTSLHVVEEASAIQVTYADGTRATGEVIASLPENDIALLATDQLPEVLVPAVLGNANTSQVGDEVVAVGNPFGLYSSASAGVISGFDRTFEIKGKDIRLEDLIQFDAAVNPGNSGGPLLNRFGQVIGIVVGIVSPGDGEFFIGIGFAVPINIAGGAAGIPPY